MGRNAAGPLVEFAVGDRRFFAPIVEEDIRSAIPVIGRLPNEQLHHRIDAKIAMHLGWERSVITAVGRECAMQAG
jgi:hypothetical protein